MRNSIVVFLLSMTSAWAQTITVTSPSSGQIVAAYAFNLTATAIGAPSAAYVIWTVDDENECMTRTPPYTCVNWDPFNVGNGQHKAVATLYDSTNVLIAKSPAVSFIIANTMAETKTNNTYMPGWTVSTSTPVTSNWTGTVTISATLSGTYPAGQSYHVYVDGLSDSYPSPASASYRLNTAKYPNGPHKVVYTYGSSDNVWTTWENTVMFSNGATPMWLELSGRETWLCPTPSTDCPSSDSITATTVNTDMSTSSATISSCGTSTNPATATVALASGACVETILRNGHASYTVTASNGLTREKWVFGYTANVNPCFGPDGKIHNAWVAGSNSCFFLNSMFFSTNDLTDANHTNPGVTKYLAPYQLAGWNTMEPAISPQGPPSYQGIAQSTFQSSVDSYVNSWCSFASSNKFFLHLGNDTWWRALQFYATRGTTQTYRPHGYTYVLNDWAGSGCVNHVIGIWVDEINFYGGSAPQQAAPKMGSTISSVVASNGTCTVTHSSAAAGLFSFENGYGPPTYEFIITGASSAGFNSAPGTYYTSSAQTDTTFTYPCASVSNGTYNSSTDPNMLFEVGFDHGGGGLHGVYQANPALPNQPPPSASGLYGGTYTGGLTASGTGSCQLASFNGGGSGATATVVVTNGMVGPALTVTALGSGFTSAPTTATGSSQTATCSGTATVATSLTDYARWNQYQTLMTDYFAATNPPLITWSNAAGTNAIAVQDWMYDPRMAQFAEMYNSAGDSASYRPETESLSITSPMVGDHYRSLVGTITEPFLMLTSGIIADYGMQGYKVPVASCSGDTITFSSPHGIYDILPWSTRLMVSGGTCAGTYWVASAPTANTLTVWRNFGTTINVSSNTGRVTFANGDVYNLSSMSATASASAISQNLRTLGIGPPYLGCERGTTFTIAATGTALDGTTGYLPFNYPGTGNCSTWSQSGSWTGLWGAIPNLSGSGGTATINANNYFTFGLNASSPMTGPVYQYGEIAYCIVLGCAGQRAYLWGNGGSDPEGMNTASAQTGYYNTGAYNLNSIFGDTSAGNVPNQFGIMPGTGNPSVESAYWAMATGNYLAQRLAKYEFQPHVASPDYGPFIEAGAHSGPPGNMLILQNMAMNSQTVRVNLSSCDVPGQQKIRYLADYTGIAVTPLGIGVKSDTPSMTPGGTVAYLCPQNFAAELQQPTISARLSDVANAARIVVRYAYLPYWVDNGTSVADCGSGTCALPVDRQIGPLYYRLIYLDANSKTLAVSDIRTL